MEQEQNSKDSGSQEEKALEEVFEELQGVISRMEEEVPLEEAFQLYHQGMDMLKTCSDKIDRVEKKMLVLDETGETQEF